MSQATPWDRPPPPDRLGSLVTLIVALGVVAVLCVIGYLLRSDIVNPSTGTCLSVVVAAPLIVLGRLLYGRRRRRRIRDLRDARRGGISIGIARPRRERIPVVETVRSSESGRRTGRRRIDLRAGDAGTGDGHDVLILEM